MGGDGVDQIEDFFAPASIHDHCLVWDNGQRIAVAGRQGRGAHWRSRSQGGVTPAGRMVLTVFVGIAEFARSLIATRTEEGRCAAQARPAGARPSPTLSVTATPCSRMERP